MNEILESTLASIDGWVTGGQVKRGECLQVVLSGLKFCCGGGSGKGQPVSGVDFVGDRSIAAQQLIDACGQLVGAGGEKLAVDHG